MVVGGFHRIEMPFDLSGLSNPKVGRLDRIRQGLCRADREHLCLGARLHTEPPMTTLARSHRRPKMHGLPTAQKLDRNDKARLMFMTRALSFQHRQPGQHIGPITRAHLDVLRSLLYDFHGPNGVCFPGYARIMMKAHVARDTIARALRALESLGVIVVINRLTHRRIDRKLVRTSNAYVFRLWWRRADPPKSENPGGPRFKESSILQPTIDEMADSPLKQALLRMKASIAERDQMNSHASTA